MFFNFFNSSLSNTFCPVCVRVSTYFPSCLLRLLSKGVGILMKRQNQLNYFPVHWRSCWDTQWCAIFGNVISVICKQLIFSGHIETGDTVIFLWSSSSMLRFGCSIVYYQATKISFWIASRLCETRITRHHTPLTNKMALDWGTFRYFCVCFQNNYVLSGKGYPRDGIIPYWSVLHTCKRWIWVVVGPDNWWI